MKEQCIQTNNHVSLLSLDHVKRLKIPVVCQALAVPLKQTFKIKQDPLVKQYLLRKENLRNIVLDPNDESRRLILFNPKYSKEELSQIFHEFLKETNFIMNDFYFFLGYEEMCYTQILRIILPSVALIPTAFERIGHIIHLNLSSEQTPYGKLIGEVILDKHPGVRTVVSKTSKIESQFRTPYLELLAGEPDYIAEMVECGIKFYIDYENVFWNSRLFGERQRISRTIPSESLVCDVMAGVGAFTMHLAKSGCFVLSNDLNRRATECIHLNVKRNKLSAFVRVFNMDGHAFIDYCLNALHVTQNAYKVKELFNDFGLNVPFDNRIKTNGDDRASEETNIVKRLKSGIFTVNATQAFSSKPPVLQVHFLLNLPEIAIQFLNAFRNLTTYSSSLVVIHCYCFASPITYLEEIHAKLIQHYGSLPSNLQLIKVRDVAPKKNMYCIEFSLPNKRNHGVFVDEALPNQ